MSASPPTSEKRRVRRGAYLLPSALTIGNMLLGFYALVLGFRGATGAGPGAFQRAAMLVFAAGILDMLDGRIARLTGTDSDFGREYDSLADVSTFGLVPAMLAWLWGLSELGRVGWLVPLFFFVCTATRLARFNVQTNVPAGRWFVGLPSPAAAGAICSILFLVPDSDWRPWAQGGLVAALIVVGALEVSTFRYWSPKQVYFRRRLSYRAILPLAAGIFLVTFQPRLLLPVAAATYAASGPLAWIVRQVIPRDPRASESTPEGASSGAGKRAL